MKPTHAPAAPHVASPAALASLASLSALAVLCACVVACSGSSSSGTTFPDAGGAGQDGSAATDGATSPPDDSGGGGDAQQGADAGADANADAGPKDAPIDPLAVGNTWTYDVTQIGVYPLCPSGSHDAAVLSAAQRDGKLAYQTQSLCANVGTFYYAVDGDVVYWDDAATWVLVLDAPVAEGHTWSNGVTSYAWHDLGSVTVPAGTFAKCFKAQDTQGPSYTTFCRGVGPVRWSYRDAAGNGYDAVLTAKSF